MIKGVKFNAWYHLEDVDHGEIKVEITPEDFGACSYRHKHEKRQKHLNFYSTRHSRRSRNRSSRRFRIRTRIHSKITKKRVLPRSSRERRSRSNSLHRQIVRNPLSQLHK